jgi:hypothetical protein
MTRNIHNLIGLLVSRLGVSTCAGVRRAVSTVPGRNRFPMAGIKVSSCASKILAFQLIAIYSHRQRTRCRRPLWRRSASWWTPTTKSLVAPARERAIWSTPMAPCSCTGPSAFSPLILLVSYSFRSDPSSKCVCFNFQIFHLNKK